MPADLQAIRNATDPWTLYSSAIRLRKLPGNVAVGSCVFHSEKTASFRVNLAGHRFAGKFHCYGCDAKGDIYDFVRHIDGCDLPTAIRTLAADAGIAFDNTPQTSEQIRQRERDKLEREMCAWWMRQEWQKARRGLNRAMEMGPDIVNVEPLRFNLAGQVAEFYWEAVEMDRGANRKGEAGMAEFRSSGATERDYRHWLNGHLRLYAARISFIALVLDSGTIT